MSNKRISVRRDENNENSMVSNSTDIGVWSYLGSKELTEELKYRAIPSSKLKSLSILKRKILFKLTALWPCEYKQRHRLVQLIYNPANTNQYKHQFYQRNVIGKAEYLHWNIITWAQISYLFRVWRKLLYTMSPYETHDSGPCFNGSSTITNWFMPCPWNTSIVVAHIVWYVLQI